MLTEPSDIDTRGDGKKGQNHVDEGTKEGAALQPGNRARDFY